MGRVRVVAYHLRRRILRAEGSKSAQVMVSMKLGCHPGLRSLGRLAAAIWLPLMLASGAASSGTLDNVKARGSLRCGVHAGLAGFAFPDAAGAWRGIDVDVCRAVAAAVLGSAAKVTFIPLNAKDRFTALQSGEIDLLSRVTTWTLSRNTQTGVNFVGVNFNDGQGFVIKAAAKITSASELDGATICVVQGTSTEKTLADYFASRRLRYDPVAFAETEAVTSAYLAGRCDALTSDRSQLAAIRAGLNDPGAHVILPDVITKEPLGPGVRFGDDEWANVVRWSFNALLEAEELGLTSRNVRSLVDTTPDPAVRRFGGKGSARC